MERTHTTQLKVKRIFMLTFVVWALLIISACTTFKSLQQVMGIDAAPPEDYKPHFIKAVRPFSPENLDGAVLEISRSEPTLFNKLHLYAHIIDSNGFYLTGAASQKYKQLWCEVLDSTLEKTLLTKQVRVREANKQERRAQAIALVMDFSGSMGEGRAQVVNEAAKYFVERMKTPEDAVALVKYDHKVRLESPLTTNAHDLMSALKRQSGLMGFGGQTATFNAIATGIREVSTAPAPLQRVVIVFTDGNDNASNVDKEDVIQFARETNTIVCAIDFGFSIDEQYMEEIARKTHGTYNHIYAREEFEPVFRDIYRRFQDYYLVEIDQSEFGFHNIRLKLCLPTTKDQKELTAKGGYDNMPYPGSIALLNVHFDSDKSELKPQSEKAITELLKLLQNRPSMNVELRGHTDNRNSTKDPEHNVKLSQRRAQAVRDELIKRGVTSWRMIARGYGEKIPVADNATEDGRAKNRRTEFRVIAELPVKDRINALLLLPPKVREYAPPPPPVYQR